MSLVIVLKKKDQIVITDSNGKKVIIRISDKSNDERASVLLFEGDREMIIKREKRDGV